MLKKNNINIVVISLGEIEVNHDKLKELVNYCNNNNTSHLLEIDNKLELNDILLKTIKLIYVYINNIHGTIVESKLNKLFKL
jgi:hypothetical protein